MILVHLLVTSRVWIIEMHGATVKMIFFTFVKIVCGTRCTFVKSDLINPSIPWYTSDEIVYKVCSAVLNNKWTSWWMPRVQSKVTYLENTVLHVVTTLLSFLNYGCLCMQCCATYRGRARDFFACCVYLTIRRRTKLLIYPRVSWHSIVTFE
jgi:hypothetical protein